MALTKDFICGKDGWEKKDLLDHKFLGGANKSRGARKVAKVRKAIFRANKKKTKNIAKKTEINLEINQEI